MTVAALRPGAPETEPPGYVVAPVWYSPAIGILWLAQPGTGRRSPDWAGPASPPWHDPRQLCAFIRSRSSGLLTALARITSSVRFGAYLRNSARFAAETPALRSSQRAVPSGSSYGWKPTTLSVCRPCGARDGSATVGQSTSRTGSSVAIRPARKSVASRSIRSADCGVPDATQLSAPPPTANSGAAVVA